MNYKSLLMLSAALLVVAGCNKKNDGEGRTRRHGDRQNRMHEKKNRGMKHEKREKTSKMNDGSTTTYEKTEKTNKKMHPKKTTRKHYGKKADKNGMTTTNSYSEESAY